jgi:N-acetylmuramoyl-L-alanine amidase
MIKKQLYINLLILPLICLIISSTVSGETESPAQQKYYQTASCYKGLRKNPDKQQYRKEWLRCIHASEDIYKLDPNGSWATAGLYLTGHLYDKLYRHSNNKSDYEKAEQYFQKLLKRFPVSKYRERTFKALRELHANNPIFADFNTECLRPQKKAITNVAKEKEARGKFFKAEHCVRTLPKNASDAQWLGCIKRFYEVYQCDPDGRWAAAGLFQTSVLYRKLAHHTQNHVYANQAEKILINILEKFPESVYCGKSAEQLAQYYLQNPPELTSETKQAKPIKTGKQIPKKQIQQIPKKQMQQKQDQPIQQMIAPLDREKDSGARDRYFRAESCYKKLIRANSNHEESWYACIAKFIDAYKFDPNGRWAAAALFRAGRLNMGCYHRFKHLRYLNEAEDYFQRIINRFPESDYIKKTRQLIDEIQELKRKLHESVKQSRKQHKSKPIVPKEKPEQPKPIEQTNPVDKPEKKAQQNQNQPESTDIKSDPSKITIQDISWDSKPAHTRITVRTNKRVEYAQYLRKKENRIPECLFVDFEYAQLAQNVSKYLTIRDNLVNDLRIMPHENNQMRVALSLKNYHHYKIYSLKNPQRVIIDIWAQTRRKTSKKHRPNKSLDASSLRNAAIARQLALGIRRIAIDAGHGGKDGGAVGYFKGVYEKDVVLSIAKRLAQKIRQHIQCEILLTRNEDQFLPLEERAKIANANHADLFISIHTNAHPNHSVYGFETYYLNLTSDDDAIRVAALENEVSGRKMNDLDTILHDLMQNAKINESSRLAGHVQNAIYQHLKKYYRFIKDNGVKQAPFYVLMGAEMPAILIETGFISNQRDCRRLTNPAFQNHLCNAVVAGIKNYIEETRAMPSY